LLKKRFVAEGLENVINLSDFNSGDFGKKNGLEILDGPLGFTEHLLWLTQTVPLSIQSKFLKLLNKLRCCFIAITLLNGISKDNSFVTGRLKSVGYAVGR
jgi:hypothetical protein